MKLEELDKNFAFRGITAENLVWYDRYCPDFVWDGVGDLEHFHRIAAADLDRLPYGIREGYPSTGIRLRFCTDSHTVAVKAVLWLEADMNHMPRTGSHGFDLYADDPGRGAAAGFGLDVAGVSADSRPADFSARAGQPVKFVQMFAPAEDHRLVAGEYRRDCADSCRSEPGFRQYELSFPLYNGVLEFALGLEEGARFAPAAPFASEKPIVFYGSSITQGACASRPSHCYTSMVARRFDLRQINLGFSGRAKGEPEMARYIADLPMEVFVMDYDHNADTAEDLAATHESFFRTVRAAQPELPIILVTRPNTDRDPADADRRFAVVEATYRHAREAGDSKVWLVDGRRMFDGEFRDNCTVDGCHPTDLGFFRMYQGVAEKVEEALGAR